VIVTVTTNLLLSVSTACEASILTSFRRNFVCTLASLSKEWIELTGNHQGNVMLSFCFNGCISGYYGFVPTCEFYQQNSRLIEHTV
jgi:UDP-N-acetylglucosamine transferase subunit ALG13